jgi:hypothetical protein
MSRANTKMALRLGNSTVDLCCRRLHKICRPGLQAGYSDAQYASPRSGRQIRRSDKIATLPPASRACHHTYTTYPA